MPITITGDAEPRKKFKIELTIELGDEWYRADTEREVAEWLRDEVFDDYAADRYISRRFQITVSEFPQDLNTPAVAHT